LATTYSVGLEFSAKTRQLDEAFSKIQRFERDVSKLQGRNPFEGTEKGARSAASAVDRVGSSAKGAAAGVGALRNALLGLGIGAFVKTIYSAAAEIERTKVQLKTLVGTAEEAERVFSQLQQINKLSPFELKDLTGAATKLSAFGVSAKDLVSTTERLGKIAAGTGQSLDGIATAYGQVLAKGRLQGEELLQFQERGIDVGGELQRMLGVTKEQFADMTSKGQISSKLVEEAIKRMTSETGRFGNAFENTANSMDAKLSNLKDAFFNAAAALGKAFEPIFRWMIDQLTTILSMVTDAINRWQGVQSLTPERTNQLRRQAETDANKRFPGFNPFSNAKGDFYNKRLNELTDAEIAKVVKASKVSGAVSAPAPAPGVAAGDQARYRAMLAPGSSSSKAGGSNSSKAAAGPKLPEYISKEVLRKWLISQGMGRTSGDFTNAGHRTPNHMLNAMDMGFTSSKYDHNYVQKTKEMEAKLRATGAFGNQLFGPTRDPRGHATHLHIPTPGGMVKMNPALASLMGMKGGGQEGQYELAQGLAEEEAKRADDLQRSFETGTKLTSELDRQIKLMQAGSEHARKLLQIEHEYEDRRSQISELLDEGQKKTLEELNNKIRSLEITKEDVAALYEKLGVQDLLNKSYKEGAGAFRTDIDLDPGKKQGKLKGYMDNLRAELADTEGMILSLAGTIESEIGSAMSSAITGVIQGTMTVEEAMSRMFSNIGAAFIEMATQMIAKALIMKVLGIFTGGIGGGGGLFSGAGPVQFPSGGGFNGFAPGMPSFFAEGGFVTGPTRAILGEGGEPEVVLPQSKIGAAMSNYRPGSGAAGLAQAMNAPEGAGGGGSIDISYSVTEINSMRFVTEDQFQEGMAVAAKRGASGGHAQVMGDLRNKRSVRSRMGMA
jgi:tape measure domain-containing protein